LGVATATSQAVLDGLKKPHHTLVLGATGTGKSYAGLQMVINRIKSGQTVIVIDPHGTLVKLVAAWCAFLGVKPHRVRFFNPAHSQLSIGWDPTKQASPESRFYMVDFMVTAILKAFGGTGQAEMNMMVRLAKWLPRVISLPAEISNMSFADVKFFLSSETYRKIMVSRLENGYLREVWNEYDFLSPARRLELLESTENRFTRFFGNPHVEAIFSQQGNLFDVTSVLNDPEGGILLVDLSNHQRLGDTESNLLGILLMSEIARASMARNEPEAKQFPVHLFCDEAERFISFSICRILEEARKFGLFLTLSFQHLEQLREESPYIFTSVLVNCKRKLIFNPFFAPDAKLLAETLFLPEVDLLKVKWVTIVTKEAHIEETRRIVSHGSAATDSSGSSHTTTRTESDGTFQGSSDNAGWNEGQQNGMSLHWQLDGHGNPSPIVGGSLNNSSTHGRQGGQGQTRGKQHSVSAGEADSHNSSHSVTNSTMETIVPFLKPIPYKEEASRQFFSFQEQLFEFTQKIMALPDQHCVFKEGTDPAQIIKIVDVPALPEYWQRPRVLARFEDKVYLSHPFYKPRQEVLTLAAARKAEIEAQYHELFPDNQIPRPPRRQKKNTSRHWEEKGSSRKKPDLPPDFIED
jgi:hypothetical protein